MKPTFELLKKDTTSKARLGKLTTPHGTIDTPVFMPVGTQGTVKGLVPERVKDWERKLSLETPTTSTSGPAMS